MISGNHILKRLLYRLVKCKLGPAHNPSKSSKLNNVIQICLSLSSKLIVWAFSDLSVGNYCFNAFQKLYKKVNVTVFWSATSMVKNYMVKVKNRLCDRQMKTMLNVSRKWTAFSLVGVTWFVDPSIHLNLLPRTFVALFTLLFFFYSFVFI